MRKRSNCNGLRHARIFSTFLKKGLTSVYMAMYSVGARQGKERGEKEMEYEEMTNEIFETLMKSIITIIKDADSKEEAVEKIENLLKKEK